MSSKQKKRKIPRCVLIISGTAIAALVVCLLVVFLWQRRQAKVQEAKVLPQITLVPKLLKQNKYSRPGIALKKVKGVVVHYTANPGTDAIDNRNYFNNLPMTNKGKENPTYASSHFVIGLTGDIIQCIPLEEIAYASNDRNSDTVSIECCHPNKSGKFNDATYKALMELTAYLCIRFNLEASDVIRHYDVTGKLCPKYYVEHEDAWENFRLKLENKIAQWDP